MKRFHKNTDLLSKELHHRIKNNIQFIISILNLYSIENPKLNKLIHNISNKFEIMMFIHNHIYLNECTDKINFSEYLNTLILNIKALYCIESKIDLSVSVNEMYFDKDTLIYLGLITNELICNTIKHNGRNNKEIFIKIEPINSFFFKFSYKDNTDMINYKNKDKNFGGLKLIEILTEQLSDYFVFEINCDNNTL